MTTMLPKNRMLMVSVIIALVLLFALSSVSQANATSSADSSPVTGTMCVDGYVINHREVPVDGTRTDPSLIAEAHDANGAVFPAAVDSNGYFKFEDLSAGEWTFKLPLPTDWDSIVPEAERNGIAEMVPTMLTEQDDCYRIVFKIRRLFDITAIKWQERLDGTVYPGEGWSITFAPQGDPFVKTQTKTTDQYGSAVFTVTPGSWLVSEKVKSGWQPITPPTIKLTLDQYAPSGATDPVVFKNREPVCTGTIVVEKHGLGKEDDKGGLVWLGPLAGWNITLSRADGAIYPVTKTTDAAGRVTFDKLYPGVYTVKEQVQVGWKPVSANPQTIVLRNCETVSVLFENEEISGELTIHGKKIYQVWTGPAGGLGLAGWKMTATLVGTNYSTSTVTNALGEYWFSEEQLKNAGIAFPGATVEVCEEERYNWIPVTPQCVKVKFPYPVPPDYTGAVVNFTNVQDPPLPGTGGAQPTVSCQETYKVQPGDNLSSIARRFGVSVQAIAQASGIANVNYIRVGQTLCVR